MRPLVSALLVLSLLGYVFIFPKFYTNIGFFYLRTGQPASALAAYEKCLRVWPRIYDVDEIVLHAAKLAIARQSYWEARLADAQARFESLAESLSDRADNHHHLNVYVSSLVYNWEVSTAEVREALASREDNATALTALGEMVRGFSVEAEPRVMAALALRDATPACEPTVDVEQSCHSLGALLFDLGRYHVASRFLRYPYFEGSSASLPAPTPPTAQLALHRFPHLDPYLPVGRRDMAQAATVAAVLSADACQGLVQAAEAHASANGGWSRARHDGYPTTDLPLSHLDHSKPAVDGAVRSVRDALLPAYAAAFPSLSELGLYVDDAFVAKYGELGGAQKGLSFHSDGTPLSFICTLALPSAGGGTLFRAAVPLGEVGHIHSGDSSTVHGDKSSAGQRAEADAASTAALVPGKGDCLLFAGGALLHGGVPVTAGVRYLLVGFVGVGRGGGANKSSYEAYRDSWVSAKRADRRLHDEHEGLW